MATLALTLATNLASAFAVIDREAQNKPVPAKRVLQSVQSGGPQHGSTEHQQHDHEWQHSSPPLFLVHGKEYRKVEDLLPALKIDPKSKAAQRLHYLYGTLPTGRLSTVLNDKTIPVVVAADDKPGLYSLFHNHHGTIHVNDVKLTDEYPAHTYEQQIPMANIDEHQNLGAAVSGLESPKPQTIMLQLDWLMNTKNKVHIKELSDRIAVNFESMVKREGMPQQAYEKFKKNLEELVELRVKDTNHKRQQEIGSDLIGVLKVRPELEVIDTWAEPSYRNPLKEVASLPSIFFSDGLQVSHVTGWQSMTEAMKFESNEKMKSLLEKATLEAGPGGFIYLLKLNDTGLYKLIHGNRVGKIRFIDLKVEDPEAQTLAEGQMSMEDLHRSPSVQRIFAQVKSADPFVIKSQLEALSYVRDDEQRAKIAEQTLKNFEMMERGKPDDYLWLYNKHEIKSIKKLLKKIRDSKSLDDNEDAELKKMGEGFDTKFKARSNVSG